MKDIFFETYLINEAIRISRKNNENFDKLSKEERRAIVEMKKEDLEDRYRED